MAVTALIDVSPGVLTSHHQVERIKDAVFKLLLPFERTAFPTACHVLYFDSSLSADEEGERITAVRNQFLWGAPSEKDNADRVHSGQEPGDSLESNQSHHRQRLKSGQSCASSQAFDDLSRQLDGFLRKSRQGTSSRSHLTQSSLWRAINSFYATKCRCNDVSGRVTKSTDGGHTNLVVIFSSVARTDNEIANFYESPEFQIEPPHAVEAAVRTEGAGTGVDCVRYNLFVKQLKDHTVRLRTAGFEVQWADMRWEGKSHAHGSTPVNSSVLDAIQQEWSIAWEECAFHGKGLLVPHVEAWQAQGINHQNSCRGQLGWRKKTFATVSLVQIQRSEPFLAGTSEEKLPPNEEMGESVTVMAPRTVKKCGARPEFYLLVKDIRPVARLDRCKGTGEAYLLLPPPLEAGRGQKAAVAPVQDVGVGGKGGSGRVQAWLCRANASGRGPQVSSNERDGHKLESFNSWSFKLGLLIKKMAEWGEYPVVKVVQGAADEGEKREVGYGVLCPFTSTTLTIRMLDKASVKDLMPFPKAFSHDQMQDFGSWSPSPREGSLDRHLVGSGAGSGGIPRSVDDGSSRWFANIASQETCESLSVFLLGGPSGSSGGGVLDGDVSRSAPLRLGVNGREEKERGDKLMRQLEAVEAAVAACMPGRQRDHEGGRATAQAVLQECEEEVARYPGVGGCERAVEVVRRVLGRLRPALASGKEAWQDVENEIFTRFCGLLHQEAALEAWVEKWMAVLTHHPASGLTETEKATEVKEAEIQMVFGMEVLAEYERRSCAHPEEAEIVGGIANLFQACKDEVPSAPHQWFRTAIGSRYRRRLRTLIQTEMQGGQPSRKAESGRKAESLPKEETRSIDQPPPPGRAQVAMTQRQMTIRGFKKRTKRAVPPARRLSGVVKQKTRERRTESVVVSATPSPQAERKGSRPSGKVGEVEEVERGFARKSRDLKYGAKLKGKRGSATPLRLGPLLLATAKAGSSPGPPPPPSTGKKRVMHLLENRVALEDEDEEEVPHPLPPTPTQESLSPTNEDLVAAVWTETIGEGQASNMPPCLHPLRHHPAAGGYGSEAGNPPAVMAVIEVAAHREGEGRQEARCGEEGGVGGEEEAPPQAEGYVETTKQLQKCERVSGEHTGGGTASAQPVESSRKRGRQEVEEAEPGKEAAAKRWKGDESGGEGVCAEAVEDKEKVVSEGKAGDGEERSKSVCLTMTVAGGGMGHPKLERWEAEILSLFSEQLWDYVREQNKSFVEARRLATKDGRELARAVFQQEYEMLEGSLEDVLRRVRNSCTAEYLKAQW